MDGRCPRTEEHILQSFAYPQPGLQVIETPNCFDLLFGGEFDYTDLKRVFEIEGDKKRTLALSGPIRKRSIIPAASSFSRRKVSSTLPEESNTTITSSRQPGLKVVGLSGGASVDRVWKMLAKEEGVVEAVAAVVVICVVVVLLLQ